MKLQSNTNRGIKLNSDYLNGFINLTNYQSKRMNFDNFLNLELKKGFFVACDSNDNVLEEPINYKIWENLHFNNGKKEKGTIGFSEHEEYQTALENVIFEDFRIIENNSKSHPRTIQFQNLLNPYWFLRETNSWHISKGLEKIEDLVPYNLTISESAIKKYQL